MGYVLAHDKVTARKAHTCNLCRQRIEPRERYIRQTIDGDGGLDTFRAHVYCDAVLNEFFDAWYHLDGYGPEHFDEDMGEAWGEAVRAADSGQPYPWFPNGWAPRPHTHNESAARSGRNEG